MNDDFRPPADPEDPSAQPDPVPADAPAEPAQSDAPGLEAFAAETQALFESDFDPEAALDAIISGQAAAQLAALETAEPEEEAPVVRRALPPVYEPVAYTPALAMPGGESLRRGSPGALAAGLVLIALGGGLTAALSLGQPLDPLLLTVAGLGGLALVLLAHWLGSGRWARGVLFVALALLLPGALVAATILVPGFALTSTWPLLLSALGVACLLTAALGRPRSASIALLGAALIVAGAVGTLFTFGFLPAAWLEPGRTLAPALLIVFAILWALPLVIRRRT
jgi:hypothetical protein